MQAASREVGVILCALLHRAITKIGNTVGSTCVNVNSVILPVCVFSDVHTEGSQDRTHGT